jgi:hypothetical protein
MTDRILLISHNPPPMTDRAHDWVLANGFAADARYPFRGDPLPQSLDGYAGSIVYGGRFNADALEEHPFLRDEYALDRPQPRRRSSDPRHLPRRADDRAASRGGCGTPARWPDRVRLLRGPARARRRGISAGADDRHPIPFPRPHPARGRRAPCGKRPVPQPGVPPWPVDHRHAVPPGGEAGDAFRAWQDAYPGHYDRPGCQSRGDQDAVIDAAQPAQAALVRHRAERCSSRIARPGKRASARRSAASCISSGMDGSARGVSGARSPSGGPSRRKRATCLGV